MGAQLDSAKIGHFSESYWYEACDFIRRDKNDTSNEMNIEIPGLRCRLYPWQWYAVWVLIHWCLSPKNGGILGDVPGLGKVSCLLSLFFDMRGWLTWIHFGYKIDRAVPCCYGCLYPSALSSR